jgi:hypothetical protein
MPLIGYAREGLLVTANSGIDQKAESVLTFEGRVLVQMRAGAGP